MGWLQNIIMKPINHLLMMEKELEEKMIITGVKYLSQRDNMRHPLTTCYPTSMGMLVLHCLKKLKLDKTAVGCPKSMQIEDYITKHIQSKDTKNWIKANVSKYGNWMLKYKPRTIAYVENYIFNKIMSGTGYSTVFRTVVSYNTLCDILDHGIPVPIHGDFRAVSKVRGHVVLAIGYDKKRRTVIVHDPYGDAMTRYLIKDGAVMEYPVKFFQKENKLMWCQLTERGKPDYV